MRFSKLCFCSRRRKCNPVFNSQELQESTSEIRKESPSALKRLEQPAKTSKREVALFDKVIMSILPRLRKQQIKSNPYSGRGLDKFALLSAELAAKRESLAAQTGAPVSVVRFTAGSRSRWVPVFLSSAHHSKNYNGSFLNSSASEITSSHTVPTEIAIDEISITSTAGAISDFSLPSISFTSTCAATEHVATSEEPEVTFPVKEAARNRLESDKTMRLGLKIARQISFLVAILGALWISKVVAVGATVTVALVFGLLLRKQHGWRSAGNDELPETQSVQNKHQSESEVPGDETDESLHGPGSHQSGQRDYEKGGSKYRSRCKSKFLHKRAARKEFNSAPSSPLRAGVVDFFSSSTPSSPDLIRSSSSSATPSLHSRFARQGELLGKEIKGHDSPLQGTKRPEELGRILTALGFCTTMVGLLAGRCVAVFIVTFWWYTAAMMRQLARDQGPSIAAKSDDEKLAPSSKNSYVSWSGGKLDLHSIEYKKKVIMEGLLDRSLKSTS